MEYSGRYTGIRILTGIPIFGTRIMWDSNVEHAYVCTQTAAYSDTLCGCVAVGVVY